MRKATKERIAESLKGLLEEKNLDRITVKEIAERSGLTVATFYNHFRDKAELVNWIQMTALTKILEQSEEGESFEAILCRNLSYCIDNRDYLINVYENRSRSASTEHPVVDYASQLLAELVRSRGGPEELSPEQSFAIRQYAYGCARTIYEYLRDGAEQPPEVMAHYMRSALPCSLVSFLN